MFVIAAFSIPVFTRNSFRSASKKYEGQQKGMANTATYLNPGDGGVTTRLPGPYNTQEQKSMTFKS